MSAKPNFTAILLFAGFAGPALAQQDTIIDPRILARQAADGMGMIQSSVSWTVPAKEGQTSEAQQAELQAAFYKIVAGSCASVVPAIAETCELNSVTSDFRINDRSERAATVTLTGRIAMRVKFNASTAQKP